MENGKDRKAVSPPLESTPKLPNGENFSGYSVHDDKDGWLIPLDDFMADWMRRYPAAPPATETQPTRMQKFWDAQAEWSQATFGIDSERNHIGPLKHLAKEAVEAQVVPADRVEIADCQFLVFDAARRAGMTLDDLTEECEKKLVINKARKWNKPANSEAFAEHVREGATETQPSYEWQCMNCSFVTRDEQRAADHQTTMTPLHAYRRITLGATETASQSQLAQKINALPDWVRRYIHDIEAKCDPSGDIRTITELRDTILCLTAALREKEAELATANRTIREWAAKIETIYMTMRAKGLTPDSTPKDAK